MRKTLVAMSSIALIGGFIFFLGLAIKAEAQTAPTCPAEVLDLTNWKQTLPTGESKSPLEIKQPTLASYTANPYFCLNSTSDGVTFRAPVNGVTTSGSGYPRSELREMANGGKDMASWSTTSGTHTMFIDQAITSVPQTKRHIVAGQVHDSSDDVIVIRLEYPKLFIDINGQTGPTLDSNYTLGKRFTVKFVAANGQIKIYYNESQTPSYTLNKSGSGNYFKAGAYTQSNCSKETNCSSSNYGEVVIYRLSLNDQVPVSTPTPTTAPAPELTPVSSPAPATITNASFEAEAGVITPPMQISNDSLASGGKYIVQTTDTGTGNAKYTIEVPNAGQYQLRGKVITPNGSSNSVYYAFDSNSKNIWSFPDTISSWTWADGPTATLSQGIHTLIVTKREKNTKLDAFELKPLSSTSTSTSSSTTPTSSMDGTSPLEAENGTFSGGMKILSDDSSASGGKYVQADSSGSVTYSVNVPTSGTYRFAGWIKAANGSSDSFYALVDEKSSVTWTLKYPTNDWTYDLDDGHTFSLSAGTHTLTLKYREKGAKIDKLVLVKQ